MRLAPPRATRATGYTALIARTVVEHVEEVGGTCPVDVRAGAASPTSERYLTTRKCVWLQNQEPDQGFINPKELTDGDVSSSQSRGQ
jgi:hypothetical protein